MTAVEYLEEIINHCRKYKRQVEQKDIEQAKEMERKEQGKTWDAALSKYEVRAGNYIAYEDFDDYYDEQLKQQP